MAAAPAGAGGGPVSVRLVRNTGASFGIGAGHPVLVTVMAAAVLAVGVMLLARTRRRSVALFLAVAGGAAGNLADRLLRACMTTTSLRLPDVRCTASGQRRWPAWRSISRWISASETGLRPKTHQASPAVSSTHAMAG